MNCALYHMINVKLDRFLFLATGVHTRYHHTDLQCTHINKKEGCAKILRWNSLHYLMPVSPNQRELLREEPTYGAMRSNPPSGHPEKGGDEGHSHTKCPNEAQLLVWSCRLWGVLHDQVPAVAFAYLQESVWLLLTREGCEYLGWQLLLQKRGEWPLLTSAVAALSLQPCCRSGKP